MLRRRAGPDGVAFRRDTSRRFRGDVEERDNASVLCADGTHRKGEPRLSRRPLGPLRTYLLHIARNVALNERRRERSQASTLAAAQPAIARRTTPTPGQLLEESELRDAILAALDAMPERRRETFALIRFGGLSYAEAAAVMGTSEQTAANQMSAAMADLRRAIAPYTDDSA